MPELRKRIVIGGGFAGLAAAFWCRRQNPRVPVALYEREEKLLHWLDRKRQGLVPLGKQTDHGEDREADYPRGWLHAASLVEKWPGNATRDWLGSMGIGFKTADHGLFGTGDPELLRQQLERATRNEGVEIVTGFALEAVSRQPEGGFRIWSRDGQADTCELLLLATGGERNHGLTLAREFGLEQRESLPAFVRLKAASPKLGELLGPIAREIGIRCPRSGLESAGWAQFSGRGLEGEAVSRLSSRLCEDWKQRGYQIPLVIDWLPGLKPAAVRNELVSRTQTGKRRLVGEEALFGMNRRQWLGFLELSRIDPETTWMRLKLRKAQTLVQRLKAHELGFAGMGLPAGERAWAGGIQGGQIDWNTGRAQSEPGLFLAGEILDVLGMPSGPHVNLIWASGYSAGSAMALDDG